MAMSTPFKRIYACSSWLPGLLYSVPLTPQQATVDPCLHWRLFDTLWQVWLSLLWGHCSFLLGPGCKQGFVCALQGSVSPLLWKFCNHIPLAFNLKFPGGSQSLCQIPRLGNLLSALEPSQQCQNIWYHCSPARGSSVGGSMVGLVATSSKRS